MTKFLKLEMSGQVRIIANKHTDKATKLLKDSKGCFC